jgi:predicted DNA-binding transcriptional regulator AlpA
MTADRLLTADEVMARYGYKARSSFWQFVHAKGVPHIQLNARKIVFSPAALEAWEAKRTVGARK